MTEAGAKCISTSSAENKISQSYPTDNKPSKSTPAVSVVIPAFNAAPHIAEALDSVFSQTFPNYEVIVINDGSPDTPELERALAPYRERIVYLKQENLGPSAARNAGILQAHGTYVAFLDSDDIWESNHLDEQMKALREDPSLDMIYGDALLFGEGVPPGLTFMQAAPSLGRVTFESLLKFDCSIITSCVTARKEALVKAGLFDPKFFRSEDYDLWLRLAHRGGRLDYLREVVARHRVHKGSLAADMTLMFESQVEVYQKLARELTLSPQNLELIDSQIKRCNADIAFKEGRELFAARQYAKAAESLSIANEFYRSAKLRLVIAGLRFAPRLLWSLHRLREKQTTEKLIRAERHAKRS